MRRIKYFIDILKMQSFSPPPYDSADPNAYLNR